MAAHCRHYRHSVSGVTVTSSASLKIVSQSGWKFGKGASVGQTGLFHRRSYSRPYSDAVLLYLLRSDLARLYISLRATLQKCRVSVTRTTNTILESARKTSPENVPYKR